MFTPTSEFNVRLTQEEILFLGQLLYNQPYKQVALLIAKLESQVKLQQGIEGIRNVE